MSRAYWKCFHDKEPMVCLLSDNAAGRLFKAILHFSAHYETDGSDIGQSVENEERILYMCMCNEVKRDSEKCSGVSDIKSEIGRKGGIASGKSRRKKAEANEANASQTKQMLQIEAKRSEEEENEEDEEDGEENEYEEDEENGDDDGESIGALSPPGFVDFFKEYPRKVDEDAARSEWEKIKPDEAMVQIILSALDKWKRSKQWEEPQYIPYPANWLSRRLWESPPEPVDRLANLKKLYHELDYEQSPISKTDFDALVVDLSSPEYNTPERIDKTANLKKLYDELGDD